MCLSVEFTGLTKEKDILSSSFVGETIYKTLFEGWEAKIVYDISRWSAKKISLYLTPVVEILIRIDIAEPFIVKVNLSTSPSEDLPSQMKLPCILFANAEWEIKYKYY